MNRTVEANLAIESKRSAIPGHLLLYSVSQQKASDSDGKNQRHCRATLKSLR